MTDIFTKTYDAELKKKPKKNLAPLFSSKRTNAPGSSDDWETPQDLFDQLNREFRFTLDVCASADNTKCAKFYDEAADGLAQSWAGERCWMNPPYSQIGKWIEKAMHEVSAFVGISEVSDKSGGRLEIVGREPAHLVVCLVPARTDTQWWHNFATMADEIMFIEGRLKFGGGKSCAPFPSAILVFSSVQNRQKVRWLRKVKNKKGKA